MGRFHVRPNRVRNILTALLLLSLAVIFHGGAGMTWPAFFASSHVMEASAAMFDSPPQIDGKRAYGYLKKICEIGPRTAGSEANARQLKLVKEHFTKLGADVREQPFVIQHPQTGANLTLVNLIGSWHPERNERVVIGAHYDTRPHPDEEVDPNRHAMPFLGANDGASGVALEMEIAHHLNNLDTRLGVDLVLFDGEELVFGNERNTRVGEYFHGSIEFARRYAEQRNAGRNNGKHYAAGIVLDMVGGRNLQLPQDPYSLEHAPRIVSEIWGVARSLRAKSFRDRRGPEVTDDHIALNEAGIPTVDIIDFKYPYWHKADDLPENCSAESLEEVGRVVTAWLAARPAGVAAPKVAQAAVESRRTGTATLIVGSQRNDSVGISFNSCWSGSFRLISAPRLSGQWCPMRVRPISQASQPGLVDRDDRHRFRAESLHVEPDATRRAIGIPLDPVEQSRRRSRPGNPGRPCRPGRALLGVLVSHLCVRSSEGERRREVARPDSKLLRPAAGEGRARRR